VAVTQLWNVRRHSHITMKTKTTITILVSAALAAGFLAGKFQASSSWNESNAQDYYQRAAGDAYFYAMVLSELRSGLEADAIDKLEHSLDGSLLSLDHLPVKQRTESIRLGIIQARDYRNKYPWAGTPPKIEPGIQRVLTSIQ
jgi:hypothetical protein